MVSFIYADLIVIPLLLIYRNYYGHGPTLRIMVVLFLSMVLAGLAMEVIFNALHLLPTGLRPESAVAHAKFAWNYTTWLDLAATVFAGFLFYLHRRGCQEPPNGTHEGHGGGHEHPHHHFENR